MVDFLSMLTFAFHATVTYFIRTVASHIGNKPILIELRVSNNEETGSMP